MVILENTENLKEIKSSCNLTTHITTVTIVAYIFMLLLLF